MRGQLIAFTMLFLTCQAAIADYQYTQTIVDTQNVTRYYLDNGRQLPDNLNGKFLTLELGTWKESLGTIMNYRIRVTNKIPEPVSATINYLIEGKTESRQVNVDPLGHVLIEGTYPQNIGPPDISNSRITYHNIFSKNEIYEIPREECKMCNGECCLNDNVPCKFDSECGSGICNIAGYCGNEKIVPCPPEKDNCENKACLQKGVKALGEPYTCTFECTSGYGENERCTDDPKTALIKTIIFISTIILILGVSTYLISKAIRNARGKQILKQLEKLRRHEAELDSEIHKLRSKREKIEESEKLKRLKVEKEQLEVIIKETRERTNELKAVKQNEENIIDGLLRWYKHRYGHEFVLENGYIKFAKSLIPGKKPDYFHRWWYRKNHKLEKIPSGYEVDHIDGNKLNNDISNLQLLTIGAHKNKTLRLKY
jgi:hypothetical protein